MNQGVINPAKHIYMSTNFLIVKITLKKATWSVSLLGNIANIQLDITMRHVTSRLRGAQVCQKGCPLRSIQVCEKTTPYAYVGNFQAPARELSQVFQSGSGIYYSLIRQ